jgi:hypothetical protein
MIRNDEELIADAELANELHQKPNTLTSWRNRGIGPAYVKIGRRVFYRRSDVSAWLAAQRREPCTAAERRSA